MARNLIKNLIKIKPIRPDDVLELKKTIIPDQVIGAFNHLIAKNFSNGMAVVKQKDIVSEIMTRMELDDSNDIFNNHWLDVEEIYGNSGWHVNYDKPAYNEDYDAFYEFSTRK